MPSVQVSAAARKQGIRLSLNYDTLDPAHAKLDFFISQNHTDAFYGFAQGTEHKVTLIEMQVLAYYSYFGYVLWGVEVKKEEEDMPGSSGPPQQ
jgi:hypothetical protein